MKALTANMRTAAQKGFINATDLADYMVRKGLPFRTAYKLSGQIVADCIARNLVLEDYPLEDYRAHSPLIAEDVYEAVDLAACVEKRVSLGGTSVSSVRQQIEYVRNQLHQG